jgi:hypothetical protein
MGMKPLMIPGVPLCIPVQPFVMISPMGKASDFATWEELKSHVLRQLQCMKLEMLHYRFFVFSSEWREVPLPVQWPLTVPLPTQKRHPIHREGEVQKASSSSEERVAATPKKSK